MIDKLTRAPLGRIQAQIDKLVRERRAEVLSVIRRFRRLTRGKQRNYGAAALFLIASLELAIQREKKR
jgi:hypothetical protein